jgi:hypothetical protein
MIALGGRMKIVDAVPKNMIMMNAYPGNENTL